MSYGSDTEGGAAEGVGGGSSSGGYDSSASGSEPSSTGGGGSNSGMSVADQYASYGEGRAAAEASVRESSGNSGYSADAGKLVTSAAGAPVADSAPPAKGVPPALQSANTVLKTVMSGVGMGTGPFGLLVGLVNLATMFFNGDYSKLGLGTSPPTNPNTGPSAPPSASGFPGARYAVGDHSSSYSAPVIGWAGTPANTPAAQAAPTVAPLPIQAARLAPATRTAAPTTTTASIDNTGALGVLLIGGVVLAIAA